jgi:hypothetical protein
VATEARAAVAAATASSGATVAEERLSALLRGALLQPTLRAEVYGDLSDADALVAVRTDEALIKVLAFCMCDRLRR